MPEKDDSGPILVWFRRDLRLVDNPAFSWAVLVPCIRIFNPVAQSRCFDAEGQYFRTWLPELRRLPDKLIHAPWQAPDSARAETGLRFGEDYPLPIATTPMPADSL